MYYADELVGNPAHHCIGVATSKNILGPYTPNDTPWACPIDQGGAIDADSFQDVDGKRYVVYKVDGNSIGHGGECMNSVAPIIPTPILLQAVAADGITPIDGPVEVLDRDVFDGPLIEAPSLHCSPEGIYFLFFSSNCFSGPLYDTSYATAKSIYGPYTKSERPLFITGDGPNMRGPGGSDIVKDGSRVVLHGHLDDATGYVGYTPRGMYTAQLTFSGTTVTAR
jgi:beta-xylosidase